MDGDQANISNPAIVWIIGDRTDAGKTTLAVAVIRALNAEGKKSIGFKPYAGTNTTVIIDMLAQRHKITLSRLWAPDTVRLSHPSFLDDLSMVEVLNPSYRLAKDGQVLLVRKGSLYCGDRKFLRPVSRHPLHSKSQLDELAAEMDIPVGDIHEVECVHARELDQLSTERIESSLKAICKLGPKVVVIEGASEFLPAWRGCPSPDVIFAISGDWVFSAFGHNIKIRMRRPTKFYRKDRSQPFKIIKNRILRTHVTKDIWKTTNLDDISVFAEQIAHDLLSGVGLIT